MFTLTGKLCLMFPHSYVEGSKSAEGVQIRGGGPNPRRGSKSASGYGPGGILLLFWTLKFHIELLVCSHWCMFSADYATGNCYKSKIKMLFTKKLIIVKLSACFK